MGLLLQVILCASADADKQRGSSVKQPEDAASDAASRIFKTLTRHGLDLSLRGGENEDTLLITAVKEGDTECVQALLRRSASLIQQVVLSRLKRGLCTHTHTHTPSTKALGGEFHRNEDKGAGRMTDRLQAEVRREDGG